MPDSNTVIYSDSELLRETLMPYKTNCRYLKKGHVEFCKSRATTQCGDKNLLLARGEFSIPESSYIASTGHFNAVEFNICYNQLGYYLLAECVQNNLLKELEGWDKEEFYRRQLSDILIVEFYSKFRKLMDSYKFEGYVEVKDIFKKKKTLFIQTVCGFNDEKGGYSTGKVLFAIINNIKYSFS